VRRSVNLTVITVGPEAYLPVERKGGESVVLYATKLREASRPSAVLASQMAANGPIGVVRQPTLRHTGLRPAHTNPSKWESN